MTLAHVYYVLRLLRLENERLMKLGYRHMNVDEMGFVISGVLGPKGRALFDEEVARLADGGRCAMMTFLHCKGDGCDHGAR